MPARSGAGRLEDCRFPALHKRSERSRRLAAGVVARWRPSPGPLLVQQRLARCARSQHYWWLKKPAYAQAFAEAREEACDALESEARRRAVKGVRRPVYYKGKLIGYIRKYSDTLLIFLMKAARPDKYRDNVKIKKTESAELIERLNAGRARAAAAREREAA